jgi:hypothetical protein
MMLGFGGGLEAAAQNNEVFSATVTRAFAA